MRRFGGARLRRLIGGGLRGARRKPGRESRHGARVCWSIADAKRINLLHTCCVADKCRNNSAQIEGNLAAEFRVAW